jgi:branched-chain amino acid transport system permease protein
MDFKGPAFDGVQGRRPWPPLLAIAVLAIAAIAVPFGGNYAIRLATTAAMDAALVLSWNLIGGLAGYPSFGTAAFFGLGAYAGAMLQAAGWPVWVAWGGGMAASSVFASVIGPVLLRLRGHYFAVATLVLAPVLRELINSADDLTGGGMGLSLPIQAGSDPAMAARHAYFAMLTLAVVLAAGTAWIIRSRLGWALRCIEQNEAAASVLGVNALVAKCIAFTLSAAGAGVAGAIYAGWIGYIDPTDVFDDLLSVQPIVMALMGGVGGVGGVGGPIIGALVFVALEELVWRNFLGVHEGLLGLLIVVLIVFMPGGMGRLTRLRWWPAR